MKARSVFASMGVAVVAVSVVSAAFSPEPMFFRSMRPAAVASIPGVEIDGRIVPDPQALRAALDELGGILVNDAAIDTKSIRAASADVSRDPPARIVPAGPLPPAPASPPVSGRLSVRVERSDKGGSAVIVCIETTAECNAPRVITSRPAVAEPAAPALLTPPDGGR